MKIQISTSAPRLTAKLLISKRTGSYHGGMQQVSNIEGRDVLWNYVVIKDGKTSPVLDKESAEGIVCQGKYFKL